MPYIQQSDILTEMSYADLAKLTGDASGTTVNEQKVEAAIASADALIDALLYGRYAVPMAAPDDIIKHISLSFTIFNLNSYKFSGSFVPNEVLSRKLEAMNLLDSIYSGKIRLSSPPRTIGILTNNAYRKRYFTDENLEEFRNFRE